MPQTGQVSLTITNLLQKYKEWCAAERKKRSHMQSRTPLLPVSFGQAKDWMLRQQRAQSIAIQEGIVNDSAREAVSELRQPLTQQPPFAAALLQQPPHTASPTIPPPNMSLGPDQVTSQEKAAEREEQHRREQHRRLQAHLAQNQLQARRRRKLRTQSWKRGRRDPCLPGLARRISSPGKHSFFNACPVSIFCVCVCDTYNCC